MKFPGIGMNSEQKASNGPARLFVAKLFQPAACLLILLCAGGCDSVIEFEGETIVLPDSAVTRKTRVMPDQAQKGEVQTRYILPPDGKWESGKRIVRLSDGKEKEIATSIYEVEKQYPPGSAIASDYVRKAEFSKQVSRNEPRLTVRNYVFVKSFDYEERFRDIVTQESFEQTTRKIYAGVIEHGARYLAQERQDGLTAAQASAAIRATFDPLLETFVTVVRTEGVRAALTPLFKEEFKEFEPERVAARVIEVLPPATGQDAESWRKAIAKACEKASEATAKEFPAFGDEIFGVYGFNFRFFGGPYYRFTVALSLPGELVQSNASRQEGNRLVWVFRPGDFLLKDRILRARSRLVYPDRIAMAGAALMAIITGWWFSRLRTKQNRTGQKNGSV